MKKLFVLFAFSIGVFMPASALLAPVASADSRAVVCEGIGLVGANGTCTEDDSEPNVSSIIRTAIQILAYAIGIAAVIMIVLGGFKYVTSAGDASKVKSAKDTIMYALIGLVVAALAHVLVQYVLVRTTNPGSSLPPPSNVPTGNR